MPDPSRFKDKKKFMEKCIHQTLHKERKEKEQGVAQCLNMWRSEHGGKPAPKKACVAEFLRQVAQGIMQKT